MPEPTSIDLDKASKHAALALTLVTLIVTGIDLYKKIKEIYDKSEGH
jgi:hypothetical protein